MTSALSRGAPLRAACRCTPRMLADDGALAAAELPSDTLVALRLLRRQFPRGAGCDALPRLLLTSQVYSLVTDRAAVDRELAALARAGVVRRFKLATGRDDFAFLLAEDYAELIAAARAEAASRGVPPAALTQAFDAFEQRALPAWPDAAAVAASALRDVLRRPAAAGGPPLPERAVDDALAALMNAGLVARAMTPGADALLFSAPGTGAFQRALQRGRAALRQAVSRKIHQQALRYELERLKLRGCPLPVAFLIRDLVGSGALSAVQVHGGTLLRLVEVGDKLDVDLD